MTKQIIKHLKAKRAESAAALEKNLEAARQVRADLEHVEGAIRLLDPDAEAVKAKSKALALAVSSEKGQFASIMFEKLRAAPGPCTAREIADHAMEDRGMDKSDAE